MKNLPILALSATVAITPAFAETTTHYNTPITELSTKQADLSFAFDDVENLQAIVMTDKEMAETEGAFSLASINTSLVGRGALMGANIANWEYLGGVVAGSEYNPYEHAFHVGVGAVSVGGATAKAGQAVMTPTQYYIASRLGAAITATEQRLSEINY